MKRLATGALAFVGRIQPLQTTDHHDANQKKK